MRNEYPRPDFKRDSFVSLNGTWEFCFDDYNVGHKEKWFAKHDFDKKIEVPFSFETKLSGIHDTTYHDHVWYHKKLKDIKLSDNHLFILHFEGVDYYSEVYINGYLIKDHYGSNAGFQVDITNYLVEGENDLVVYCFDPSKDRSIPRGKQDWELEGHAIWYTRTTGIYKSVWLEQVDKKYIKNFFVRTKLDRYCISYDVEVSEPNGTLEIIVYDGNDSVKNSFKVTKKKNTYEFCLPNDFVNDRIWTLQRPFLFDINLILKDDYGNVVDKVNSYLGIREVKTENGKVLLNGLPIYQKLVLNQGYYVDGNLTAPTVEDMEKDIDDMIAMGFNGCRIHQKTEDPLFLYLCDKKGFLVWQECAENYGYSNLNQRRMINEWMDIVKNNYNHPSIICYTPLNESWGVEGIPYSDEIQNYAMSLYYTIKSLDPTRLVISNDGWEQCKTDLITVHNYSHGREDEVEKYEFFTKALSTRENILRFENINRYIINPGFIDENQPIILSEFGGVALTKDTGKKAWGYTSSNDEEKYVDDLKRIYKAIQKSKCIVGICYTQLTDVEQEVNGLMTFDRKFKVDPKIIKSINDMLKID